MALKAAAAASLAWLAVQGLAVQGLGGAVEDYAYYAPLGAVIAVSSTVAGSLRGSVQGVLAILLGATLSVVVVQTPLPAVLGLAVVVALGTVLAAFAPLGSMRSWVPISALFVLVIGQSDLADYVVAYLGLTGLGALIGIVLNLLFPPLPVGASTKTIGDLRDTLAAQLTDLAEGLRHDDRLTRDDWVGRRHDVSGWLRATQEMVGHVEEAKRGNWRARRWRNETDQQYQHARALGGLALVVEDVTALVVEREHADRHHVALGPDLRSLAADALERTARMLGATEGVTADPQDLREVDAAIERFAAQVRAVDARTDGDTFAAGAVVTALRRMVATLVPPELAEDLPSGG